MKSLLLAATLLFSTSCVAQEQPTPVVTPVVLVAPVAPPVVAPTSVDVYFRCVYKYDGKYNIEFLASKRVEFHPPSLPELLVYRITDTRGQNWSINQYDWENYNCVTSNITKG